MALFSTYPTVLLIGWSHGPAIGLSDFSCCVKQKIPLWGGASRRSRSRNWMPAARRIQPSLRGTRAFGSNDGVLTLTPPISRIRATEEVRDGRDRLVEAETDAAKVVGRAGDAQRQAGAGHEGVMALLAVLRLLSLRRSRTVRFQTTFASAGPQRSGPCQDAGDLRSEDRFVYR